MAHEEEIAALVEFRELVKRVADGVRSAELRTEINRKKARVRRLVAQAGAFRTFTIGPPPAVGGLIMNNVDVFEFIFEPIYLRSMNPQVLDMIDEAIGAIEGGALEQAEEHAPEVKAKVREGYVFVAMAIDDGDTSLVDVLDAIKQAAKNVGLFAERIDEQQSNERITDRILQSIRDAQFVVADLTEGRPNVFYEAGYAHGFGKIPIYVARSGTKLEFDIKDYPIIFFDGTKMLRERLEARLREVATEK